MEGNHHKISPTAVIIAKIRAENTDMLFWKEIYNELVKRKSHARGFTYLLSYLSKLSRKSNSRLASVEGRYLSLNLGIKSLGDCDIIELASGLSPRALEFDNNTYMDIGSSLNPFMPGINSRRAYMNQLNGIEDTKYCIW